jgi:hypothetical protein
MRKTQWFYGKRDAKYVIVNYEILRIDIAEIQE